jgi:AcrR family transcriptional regulator
MPGTRKAPDREGCGRERLLRAAAGLFAAKGYAATTVRDILRAAGVTAPALYYHFGSKEGVFKALVREAVQKFDAAQHKALARASTASGRVRGYCRASAAVRREYADLAWIMDAILSGPPEAAPLFDFKGRIADAIRRLQGFVRQGIESGEFRACDTRHAALALLGAVEIAGRPRVYGSTRTTADEQLEGMLSVILCGLAARSAPRPVRGRSLRRQRALDGRRGGG